MSALHWRVKDLSGLTFGRLVVLSHAGQRGVSRNHWWKCRCSCGVTLDVNGGSLRSGETKSCGCYQRDRARGAGDRTRTHGQSRTSNYGLWQSMIQRCCDSGSKDFKNYGARGIKVCDRWLSFENFIADMGARPAGKSLNRKDNNGDYTPENCEWATLVDQARNTRANRRETHNGKTLCLAEWAELAGLKYNTLSGRLHLGWSFSRAIETPVIRRSSHVQMP